MKSYEITRDVLIANVIL